MTQSDKYSLSSQQKDALTAPPKEKREKKEPGMVREAPKPEAVRPPKAPKPETITPADLKKSQKVSEKLYGDVRETLLEDGSISLARMQEYFPMVPPGIVETAYKDAKLFCTLQHRIYLVLKKDDSISRDQAHDLLNSGGDTNVDRFDEAYLAAREELEVLRVDNVGETLKSEGEETPSKGYKLSIVLFEIARAPKTFSFWLYVLAVLACSTFGPLGTFAGVLFGLVALVSWKKHGVHRIAKFVHFQKEEGGKARVLTVDIPVPEVKVPQVVLPAALKELDPDEVKEIVDAAIPWRTLTIVLFVVCVALSVATHIATYIAPHFG